MKRLSDGANGLPATKLTKTKAGRTVRISFWILLNLHFVFFLNGFFLVCFFFVCFCFQVEVNGVRGSTLRSGKATFVLFLNSC